MTIDKNTREIDHKVAFAAMLEKLGDGAIDTTFFDAKADAFVGVLRTTWEELLRAEYIEQVGGRYRFTSRGWLLAMETSEISASKEYQDRLGRFLAVMKKHVKGRQDSDVVELRMLAEESGEPEGWIFNVVDSRASSSVGGGRIGASWFGNERGRLVEIPVDFNLEPVDIASAMTVKHLERIEELETRLAEVEEDRSQFHCPHCDAPISHIAGQDFPEHHAYVTFETFDCGYSTADGYEESPCPYGPHWPKLEEFEFQTKQDGNMWVCYPVAKTRRAAKASVMRQVGRTQEEAEQLARVAVAPKKK